MQVQKPKQGYKLVKSFFGKYEEIPEEWEVTTHNTVCEFINGYAYSQSEFSKNGYPIIRIQNLTGGDNFVYSNIHLPEKQFAIGGDLLFAWSGTFGPFIWNGPKAAFHYHQWKVIPNNESDKQFLYYHFARISPMIKQLGHSGLGMFHMTKQGMEKFQFFKPPIKEQQKISSILLNVDSLIQQTQKIMEQTQKLKKGLMQRLFTKGIGHTKFQKVRMFPRYNEEKIPETWQINKLENLLQIIDYRGRTPPFSENGILHLRSNNIRDGTINLEEITHVSEQTYEQYMTRGIPKENDVLFTTEGPLGEVALVPKNFKFSLAQRIIVLRPKIKDLNPQFVKFLLQSNMVKRRYEGLSTGTTLGGIASKWFTKLLLPYPLNISEQQKIVETLMAVETKIDYYKIMKFKLENLKKGLMQKLLTGQIRVRLSS